MLAATPRLKLLVVHPGADWSTADVFNGYADAFRSLGHTVGTFNLHVRIARAGEWLQWNWRKAGKPAERPNEADTLYLAGSDLIAASLRGDVDWVVVYTGAYLHPDLLVMLKRAGRRIAMILTESPHEDDAQERVIPLADVVWTNERASVNRLRRANPNVLYLPTSYDPLRHYPGLTIADAQADVEQHDVVFVGTGFQERLDVLAAVDWNGIDLGLYGSYELMGSRSRLRQYVRQGPINNVLTAILYRRAKIGLNLYRRSISYGRAAIRLPPGESLNPRAVELAACGVFTISDRRAESAEVFGDLVPTFETPDELAALVRGWLADERARKANAGLLPARVATWTFRRRAEHIAAFLWAVQSGAVHADEMATVGAAS